MITSEMPRLVEKSKAETGRFKLLLFKIEEGAGFLRGEKEKRTEIKNRIVERIKDDISFGSDLDEILNKIEEDFLNRDKDIRACQIEIINALRKSYGIEKQVHDNGIEPEKKQPVILAESISEEELGEIIDIITTLHERFSDIMISLENNDPEVIDYAYDEGSKLSMEIYDFIEQHPNLGKSMIAELRKNKSELEKKLSEIYDNKFLAAA